MAVWVGIPFTETTITSQSKTVVFSTVGEIFSAKIILPVKVKYSSAEGRLVPMAKVEITIPEQLEMQIARMVDEGEFLNRQEAVEELLSTGIRAYQTSGPMDDEDEPGLEDDGMMGHDDEYVF